MKKLTCIVLFVFGLTIVSNAQTTSQVATTFQNTEARVVNDNLLTSNLDAKNVVLNDSNLDAKSQNAKPHKRGSKKFKDRTLAGKILIVTGVSVFVVLCLMFGTVSVG